MIPYLSRAKESSLSGIALVRIDVNTEDMTRIEAVVPTIQFLGRVSDKIVILSHAGRPMGVDPRLSLEGKAELLADLLKQEIRFISHFEFSKIREEIDAAPKGTIFFLENLRFLSEEAENGDGLARSLASLGDFYVNDAFPVSHRKAASIVAITRCLPHYVGLQMESEINILRHVMEEPAHPLIFILGGAKAADKIGVLERFQNTADAFLLAGTPANTALSMRNIDVMESMREDDEHALAMLRRLEKSQKLVLPIDWKWGNQRILDIGQQTIALFKEKIVGAKTIIWNGPLGLFEQSGFEGGTQALVEMLFESSAEVVLGGGETLTAFHRFQPAGKEISKRMFLSTGGGAMLEFLSGNVLPGLEALKQK